MSTDFRTSPLCIFSFNRPDYLRDTLISIKTAMLHWEMRGPVILFQDGSLSPFTNIMKCEPELIQASKKVFSEVMPQGVVFEAPLNLGIASNIYRAEKWVFEEMGYDVGVFFEDDMVLAPRYFEALAALNELAEQEPRIGMFAAYGSDGRMSPVNQHQKRAEMGSMHHNWAFGLRRTAWEAREIHTRAYMNIIKDDDYRLRSAFRIASWYTQMGWPPLATNQDIAKNVSLNHAGLIRITTNAIFAKYIGRLGEHYTNEEFDRLGFGSASVYSDTYPDETIRLSPLAKAEVERLWIAQRQTLLATRLASEQLLLNSELMISAQIIAALGSGRFFKDHGGKYLDFVSGIYRDLWCNARASMTIRSDVEVDVVEISGQIASHLPRDAVIEFFLNGDEVAKIDNRKTRFQVSISISPHLQQLKKILTTTCSVVSDPFSAGAGTDRRPLSFHLDSITFRGGTSEVVLAGAELVAETGRPE
jgi:hypothetical protein